MESPKVEKAEAVRRTGRAKGAEDVLDAFERNIGLHADGNEGFSEIRRVRDESVQRRISTGKVPPIPDPACSGACSPGAVLKMLPLPWTFWSVRCAEPWRMWSALWNPFRLRSVIQQIRKSCGSRRLMRWGVM